MTADRPQNVEPSRLLEPRERATDPRLLEMLACPLTKGRLEWRPATSELVSRAAKLAYPVRDGVPIMLPSEARVLDASELD